jgi:thiol-disulfide isomerase/thioredoxin
MTVMRAILVLLVLCVTAAVGIRLWPLLSLRHDRPEPAPLAADRGAPPEAAPLGQLTPLEPPRPAPDLTFTTLDGVPRKLADFRGRVVLVNLWATWCGPCVREMPSLDRLQAALGDRLTVLAISEDQGAAHVVEPFLAKLGLARLAVFLDPAAAAHDAFRVRGLPTSFLIDKEGRILGSLEGAAMWDAPAMIARLERYLREDQGGVVKTRG